MLSRLAPKTRRQRSRIRNRSSKQHRPHIARQLETLESRHLLALVVSNLPAEEIAADSATIGASIVEVDTNPVLSIFWGDEDGGTNVAQSILQYSSIREAAVAVILREVVRTQYLARHW